MGRYWVLIAVVVGACALRSWWDIKSGKLNGTRRLINFICWSCAAVGLILMSAGRMISGLIAMGLCLVVLFFAQAAAPFTGRNHRSGKGQKSRVESDWLVMELDHDNASLDGEVRQGAYQGRKLGELDEAALRGLWQAIIQTGDSKSLALLESYLKRRFDDEWFAGSESDQSAMTVADAYEILELKPGAGEKDIRSAHRKMMKNNHPDHGGTAKQAALINAARDLLLKVNGGD